MLHYVYTKTYSVFFQIWSSRGFFFLITPIYKTLDTSHTRLSDLTLVAINAGSMIRRSHRRTTFRDFDIFDIQIYSYVFFLQRKEHCVVICLPTKHLGALKLLFSGRLSTSSTAFYCRFIVNYADLAV